MQSAGRFQASLGACWWEEDVPELRGGRDEFDGDEGAFGVHLGRTHDVSFDFFLCFGILDGKLGALRQAFRQNDHGATGTDSVRETVQWIGFSRQVNYDGHL